jgi:hypothetical protein
MTAERLGGERDDNDPLIIDALAAGKSWRQAAEHANVSRSTVERRMKIPEFRHRVEQRREELRRDFVADEREFRQQGRAITKALMAQTVDRIRNGQLADGVLAVLDGIFLRHFGPVEGLAEVQEQDEMERLESAPTLEELFGLAEVDEWRERWQAHPEHREVYEIDLARRVAERVTAGVVDGQARPAKPAEQVAYEEREVREATRIPQPAQRPAPTPEPGPSAEDEVRASMERAREEQEREEQVQHAALLRARDEAERERQKRVGGLPWHLRALLDSLPEAKRLQVEQDLAEPATAQDQLDLMLRRGSGRR